jgi:hypothetical protein
MRMQTAFLVVVALANLIITIWAVRRAIKNQHQLDAFASRLRWAIGSLGVASFCVSLLIPGKPGIYIAIFSWLVGCFFLFFRDAAFYLGRWLLTLKSDKNTTVR